jgi:hypothetical protein
MERARNSWQEHLPCPIELREEPPPIALRAHDQRRPFQFIDHGFAVCHLAELNPVLAKWVLEFGHAELHPQGRWRESFTESRGLFGRPPVCETG